MNSMRISKFNLFWNVVGGLNNCGFPRRPRLIIRLSRKFTCYIANDKHVDQSGNNEAKKNIPIWFSHIFRCQTMRCIAHLRIPLMTNWVLYQTNHLFNLKFIYSSNFNNSELFLFHSRYVGHIAILFDLNK